MGHSSSHQLGVVDKSHLEVPAALLVYQISLHQNKKLGNQMGHWKTEAKELFNSIKKIKYFTKERQHVWPYNKDL